MNKMTMEQGIMAIMNIIDGEGHGEKIRGAVVGGAQVQSPISSSSAKSTDVTKKETPATVYDGYGHVLSVGGKKTHTGYVKGRKKSTAKDALKKDLLDAVEVVLNRVYTGKVGRNTVEGVVVRMADADYSVKITGHIKPEFRQRELGFTPTKSYITRGQGENHSSAIAKALVAEFENEKWGASFGTDENQNSFTLLEAKASGVRFEIQNPTREVMEYSFKITKKRARVCMD